MAASASDAHPFPIWNARFRVLLPVLDADGDLVTGMSTPDSELSQDCGTFADATNEATEIATSSGMYYLDLIATELDTKSTAIIVKSATAGMKTTPLVLYPVRLPVIRTGTAQAGGASSITLDASASAITDYYVGCYVNITNNTPSNALGQARRITAYNGSTKVATVEGTYGTNPSSSSTFEVLATQEWAWRWADVQALLGTAWLTPGTAGTPDVNAKFHGGTSQTGRDIGASVLLSAGTGTGQLDFTSGVVKSNLVQILATALTETAGLLAGGFKKFFNVSSPTGTLNSLPDAVPGASGGLPTTNGTKLSQTADLTAGQSIGVSGDFSATMKTSIGTAVAASAVASVTGNVGGNVAGSVGSVTAGVTLADDAITAAKFDESTAFPVKSADSGATQIARVGADGDTLETLSDQIDTIATPAQVNAEVVDALTVDVIADSVAADGSRPTIAQALLMINRFLMERSVSSTTLTVKKEDGSTSSMTFTLNDASSPTSITRAS